MTAFAHLEVHSHFSLLAATPSVGELSALAAGDGMSHLALADDGALYGAVAFDRACRAAGVQPVLGLTLPVSDRMRDGAPRSGANGAGRMVLLATGEEGYRSLCRLSSLLQGTPDREHRIAQGLGWEELREHRAGLICLSGGRAGWIERYLRAGNHEAAREYASRLAGLYGEGARLALELHAPGDAAVAREVCGFGSRLGLECVAVQPVRMLRRDEAPRLRLLAAVSANRALVETPPPEPGIEYRWLARSEVAERFSEFPGAVAAAAAVAEACGDALPRARRFWPAPILGTGESSEIALEKLARAGLASRYGDPPPAGAAERLGGELLAITRHGFAPLFLLVADAVRYARERGIPVSTRGSVANSLVAYCTGITTVDPLAHCLIFERFLNPDRVDPPDIDLDFCSLRRDEVLAYVRDRYGADHVALVGAITTMHPRSALRLAAVAHGLPDAALDRLLALLPEDRRIGPEAAMAQCLAALGADSTPGMRATAEAASSLVGLPHHLSLHAGGIVVTAGPITDVAPVQYTPKGFLATQFEHNAVDAVGLAKIDMLGVRALTVLAVCVDLLHERGEQVRLEALPQADAETGNMTARGDTVGVFQCESDGARATLRKLAVRDAWDLAVANAFFKPGPATGGMAAAFVQRYRGEAPVDYLHPALIPVLEPTKGVLLFQEQIMRVAVEVAGMSWGEANQLRRGMSKFRAGDMEQLEERFLAGCRRASPGPAMSDGVARALWHQIIAFAGYGFNQGHAMAYADVSYRCAYLKAHWPAEYLCARLSQPGGFHHPAVYLQEARRLGIHVRPPHVNHSRGEVTLEYEDAQPVIWLGLSQVRQLRSASVAAIEAARSASPFTNTHDLTARVPLQPREILHLARCGALDGLEGSRTAAAAAGGARGHADQMSFLFPDEETAPESAAERFAWERELLGLPVSVHPLDLVAVPMAPVRLGDLPALGDRNVTVAGCRIPGWTGGPGFFLADRNDFVTCRLPRELRSPRPWQPVVVSGRWISDRWGNGWLQGERLQPLPT